MNAPGAAVQPAFAIHDPFHCIPIPTLDLDRLARYFRTTTIAFFLRRSLSSEQLAHSMLAWPHLCFSVDLSVKIPATSAKAREDLALNVARPPISLLIRMHVEEHEAGALYRSESHPCIKTNEKPFPAIEFLVQRLPHLPDPRARLVRRDGLHPS